jgi:hypothetical protein
MKVSRLLAHKLQEGIQVAIGSIEAGKPQRAINALVELSKIIGEQTVLIVENCEACGLQRIRILETKGGKT